MLSPEQMRALNSKKDNTPLADLVALTVGSVGENLALRRASCLRVSDSKLHLDGYTHPAPEPGTVMLGKFGAILAMTAGTQEPKELRLFSRQLCQHVVGTSFLPITVLVPET